MSSDSDFDDDEDDEILQLLTQIQSKRQQHNDTPETSSLIGEHSRQAEPQTSHKPNPPSTSITQPQKNNNNDAESELKQKLYRSDGEVAILRAQLKQLQNQKQQEINELNNSINYQKRNNEEQMKILKFTVEKLEDEKKFLNNEVKNASSAYKKRKVVNDKHNDVSYMEIDQLPDTATAHIQQQQQERHQQQHKHHEEQHQQQPQHQQQRQIITNQRPSSIKVIQKLIKIPNDASLFTDYIWNYCINGSTRTSLAYLDRICVQEDLIIDQDFKVYAKLPISKSIIENLMLKKNLRLDDLLYKFGENLIDLIKNLFSQQNKLPVPILLSLIHATITFKKSAVNKTLIKFLIVELVTIIKDFSFLLDSSQNEEDFINYHDVPYNNLMLQNFILICCCDLVENLVCYSSQFGEEFISSIWSSNIFPYELLTKLLPENTERYKSTAQINLIYNVIEMLQSSITEETFAFNNDKQNETIIKSLLKVFLIDINVKEDFSFYGLNRIIGNNNDLSQIEKIIPKHNTNLLNQAIISIPSPINKIKLSNKEQFEITSNHELHLLNLRIKIVYLLESLITIQNSIHLINGKEYIKSIIRIIGFEQNILMRSPRSKFINIRIEIISHFIRIFYYIINDTKSINHLIYPETLYEIFVILMRIAFGSDSLSVEAHGLLKEIRESGFLNKGIFNKWCEFKSRELNHLNFEQFKFKTDGENKLKGEILSNIESDFANGLEFPYELETIELAREILSICCTHEEADNLYYNMNYEDPVRNTDNGNNVAKDVGEMMNDDDNEMSLYDL